jgi:hypothetical protein
MGHSLKFEHSVNDIILGNPRYIDLNDSTRVLLHALPISKIDKFLVLFVEGIKEKKLLEGLIECGNNYQKLFQFISENLPLKSVDGTCYFKHFDFISAYYSIYSDKTEIIQPVSAIKALVTIIEQNQLIELLDICLKYEENKQKKQKTFTTPFSYYQIIELGLVEGLTMLNINDKLTIEQKDFYLDIAEQKLKKLTEYSHLALTVAIANQFGSKQNLHDLLFANSSSDEKYQAIEEKRKAFLFDKYTGDREKDDALLKQLMEERNDKTIEMFFHEFYKDR